MALGCITRRRARARPSSSCMNMPATGAPGSRRCGSFRARTAASPTASAAIRPPTCPSDRAQIQPGQFRDDVIALMDALKIDKAHVVGHSMGAADRAACRHPLSPALHLGDGRRLRLWLEPRSEEGRADARAASRETGKMFATEGIAPLRRRAMPTGRRARPRRTRTRAAMPSSSRC